MPVHELAPLGGAAAQPAGPVDPSCSTEPLSGGPTRQQAEAAAALLRAVADPVRLRIVSIIAAAPAQEACVCELTPVLEVAQPTVSHHLKVPLDGGVLERDKRGTWAWFRLVPGRLAEIVAAVSPAVGSAVLPPTPRQPGAPDAGESPASGRTPHRGTVPPGPPQPAGAALSSGMPTLVR